MSCYSKNDRTHKIISIVEHNPQIHLHHSSPMYDLFCKTERNVRNDPRRFEASSKHKIRTKSNSNVSKPSYSLTKWNYITLNKYEKRKTLQKLKEKPSKLRSKRNLNVESFNEDSICFLQRRYNSIATDFRIDAELQSLISMKAPSLLKSLSEAHLKETKTFYLPKVKSVLVQCVKNITCDREVSCKLLLDALPSPRTIDFATNTMEIEKPKMKNIDSETQTIIEADRKLYHITENVFKQFLVDYKDYQKSFMATLHEILHSDSSPVSNTVTLLSALKEVLYNFKSHDISNESILALSFQNEKELVTDVKTLEIKNENKLVNRTNLSTCTSLNDFSQLGQTSTSRNYSLDVESYKNNDFKIERNIIRKDRCNYNKHGKSCTCLDCIIKEVYVHSRNSENMTPRNSWLEDYLINTQIQSIERIEHPPVASNSDLLKTELKMSQSCSNVSEKTSKDTSIGHKHSSQCCCIDCITKF